MGSGRFIGPKTVEVMEPDGDSYRRLSLPLSTGEARSLAAALLRMADLGEGLA